MKENNPKAQNPPKKKEKTAEQKAEEKRKAEEKKKKKKEEAAALLQAQQQGTDSITTTMTTTTTTATALSEAPKPEKRETKISVKETTEKQSTQSTDKTIDKIKEISNKQERQKKQKRIFALTTYEERLEEKKQNQPIIQEIMTSKDIIEIINNETLNTIQINEELIISLLNISKSGFSKQAKICTQLMKSLIKIIENMTGDTEKIISEIRLLFDKITKIIPQITNLNGGLDNTCIYLKRIKEILPNFKQTPATMIKNAVIEKLQEFLQTKINTKHIISDNDIIKENDYLLIYGKSKIFRKMLSKAVDDGIKFKVVFVDTRKENQIKSEIEYLSKLGVNVMYTYLNGISGIIAKITKVFIKGKSMLSNGYLQGQVGASLLACIANNFKKPVIVFCQTYQFWDKIMLDSLQGNNFHEKESTHDGLKYTSLELQYDITPANYINMIVCELGYIPPTSVPVVIREFGQKEIENDFIKLLKQ